MALHKSGKDVLTGVTREGRTPTESKVRERSSHGLMSAQGWRRWLAGGLLAFLASAVPAYGQFDVSQQKAVGISNELGFQPRARLLLASDGFLYGSTDDGGGSTRGTIYRLDPNSGEHRVLRVFTGRDGDGANLSEGLTEGLDGYLYGVTAWGGAGSTNGTIIRLGTDGAGYQVLHLFGETPQDGVTPRSELFQGPAGQLYGTTQYGGESNQGVLYRLEQDGSDYTILHHFAGGAGDGAEPTATLIRGSNGNLLGTTVKGGAGSKGVVYEVNLDGTGYQVLRSFGGGALDGAGPSSELLVASDGYLYGMTTSGGPKDQGVIFRMNGSGGEFSLLHTFDSTVDAAFPFSGLVEGETGRLFGTSQYGGVSLFGAVFSVNKDGSGYRVAHHFNGAPQDGAFSYTSLTKSAESGLFGVTYYGGSGIYGTVFRMEEDGTGYTLLREFSPTGGQPATLYAGLLMGSDGLLYGAGERGGTEDLGAVFRMQPNGQEYALIYSLSEAQGGAQNPYTALIEGSDGMLYGTTIAGGQEEYGTVFRANKEGGNFSILHHFTASNWQQGVQPYAKLLELDNGVLYGVTAGGGNDQTGVIFSMNRDGSGFQVLHHFGVRDGDGASPTTASLMQGTDGRLYGTTTAGGSQDLGTVYVTGTQPDSCQVVHSFAGGTADGAGPWASVIEGSNGRLYGTTLQGGAADRGVVYALNNDGTGYEILHHFSGGTDDGASPYGALVEGWDGFLYGTTWGGGAGNSGVIFRLRKDGSSYEAFYGFGMTNEDGLYPFAGLTLGIDGALYGTTTEGGIGWGTVFRVVPVGSLAMSAPGELVLSGPEGSRFSIQSRLLIQGLPDWQVVTNVTLAADPVVLSDPNVLDPEATYYRALLTPSE